ncbi:DinB family protein [Paenibacillus sp. HN-1]|uniref:DinB family protein n=1 Tax=Paenibacillus TaxID=44249 RepID=UPI001CA7CDAF|nr:MULTISPECIES: DinB family protein [Paenibacillus]MBY9080655.1 DinB family protein [Paenibacillus sp. CGMCC 1.18879]MBY9085400.1 DinB family protein [Paenibacillus sinensis]
MNLTERKTWNEEHKRLTAMILVPGEHRESVSLLLRLHGRLHASGGGDNRAGYEDMLLMNITEDMLRRFPVQSPDSRNPVIWHLWHSARIEDIAMNMLVAGAGQVLEKAGMQDAMRIRFIHSGNEMTEEEMAELSREMRVEGLLEYRRAVARRTREIVESMEPGQFRRKVEPERILRIREQGAVTPQAGWLADYWSGKTVGGLMLMPATRHHFVHLNKAMRIKGALQRAGKEKQPRRT